MTAQVRSELLKLRSTRTAMVFLLLTVALVVLGVVAPGLTLQLRELSQEDKQRELFGAETNAILFATYVGLLGVTNEFRYGTIRSTLLFQPRRRVVLGAKLVAAALVGVVFAVIAVAVAFVAVLVLLAGRDVDVALSTGDMALMAGGTIAAAALAGMFGVTVGALIRNQVGAIIALGAYTLAFDAVLFAAAPSVGRFLPGQASNALAGLPQEHLLAPGIGGAVILAWVAAFVVSATVRGDRSDV